MHLIRGLHNLKEPLKGSVVTIGNYDGLHRGHQQLLKQLERCKHEYQLPSVVIVFEPQPREFFDTQSGKVQTIPRMMRLTEKWLALRDYSVDYLLCLYFNRDLASLGAEDFVDRILLEKLNMRSIVVGHDFHFGAGRRGTFSLLQKKGEESDFSAIQIPALWLDEEIISSTRLRAALTAGNMECVRQLLGRDYSIYGRVCYGSQRGRDLGFPTANINLHRVIMPISGVFVVRVRLGSEIIWGVANVGNRPTFDGTRIWLEVHLFDFNRDIYGQHIEVELLHKLRDEKRFNDFSALLTQIKSDVEHANEWIASAAHRNDASGVNTARLA